MGKKGNMIVAGFLGIAIIGEGVIHAPQKFFHRLISLSPTVPEGLPIQQHTHSETSGNPIPFVQTQIVASTASSPSDLFSSNVRG